MDRKTAKEILHLREWLQRVQVIVDAGSGEYNADPLLQEAGDSLMMKIGEAANRLARAGLAAPPGIEWSDAIGNRNWLIHQYDQIDRAVTWATLTKSLTAWRVALSEAFVEAAEVIVAPDESSPT